MGASSSKCPPNGGLRVHRVYPNGPGDVAGVEPFFDYILDVDGYTYTDDSDETLNLFTKYVNDHENQQIALSIYNARKKNIRDVYIVPQKWDGIGLLGLTLKFGLFNCLDEGAHIVHVYDKSPAQKAGLMPITDYLLGTNLQLFYGLDCVRIHVANKVDKEVVLIVYNSVTETVRRALIVPRENWGGRGTLGCDLAKGYIHRIPYVKSLFTYPTIETFPSINSQATSTSKDVVDTIDLSVGNVNNYYANTENSTIRDDLSSSERHNLSVSSDSGRPEQKKVELEVEKLREHKDDNTLENVSLNKQFSEINLSPDDSSSSLLDVSSSNDSNDTTNDNLESSFEPPEKTEEDDVLVEEPLV
ncbi:GRASP55/65 PDZ-like domain protein [Theileria parva strain Muguga]|uniref:GRASP55/65 PDZ-like domain protein n=1 Tax=Theileria parva strain Muguga TaxID=333668 RepID=UPI001C6221F1|nr:GRASP55/65 PDZ-like domain protein [Theileria parva strain Muguga]EAN30984.2 GRASP55/65 PDZ-like domain protein [Theileria parva strain Muguga]